MNRFRVVLALVPLLVVAGANPAAAELPLQLDEQVTDRVGALADDAAAVGDAVAELRGEGVALHVVLVDEFDGDVGDVWAEETAERSGLGESDILFAVAVDDAAYQ